MRAIDFIGGKERTAERLENIPLNQVEVFWATKVAELAAK
jgi:hypothetical protein